MTIKKKIGNAVFFLLVLSFTIYTLFKGQDLKVLWESMRQITIWTIIASCLIALLFVCGEGFIIWFLYQQMKGKSNLIRCIRYSFVGFFYSGITPSATGGQPIQLYQMKKDGNSLADSSVILITVGTAYKLVLVMIGLFLLIFWNNSLHFYLGGEYFILYCIGLSFNIIIVIALLIIMVFPKLILKIIKAIEFILIKVRILKKSLDRDEKITNFIFGYSEAVSLIKTRPYVIFIVMILTFIQRAGIFFITYFIYKGFHLNDYSMITIIFIQASIYVAVDMLPLPGAQGITEMMYKTVYSGVFGIFLIPSLCLIRGMSFYFLLFVSIGVVVYAQIYYSKRQNKT